MNKETIQIKRTESLAKTFAKRAHQICKVFDIKIDDSHLSRLQQEHIAALFREGKWLYNSLIARMEDDDFDIFKHNVLKDSVIVRLDENGNPIKQELEYIPAAVKQTLHKRICSSLKTLSTLKKRGYEVGKLKFKSEYNSLTFRQFGVTHKICGGSKVRLAGVKGRIRVRGLNQLEKYDDLDYDITSWNLVRKADGYHILMSVFFDKDQWYRRERRTHEPLDEDIGIDFGCSSSLTLSDGRKFSCRVEEDERLKRLQRKLQRRIGPQGGRKAKRKKAKQKRSNNTWRLKRLIRREHLKMTNRKNDMANKFVAALKPYRRVVIQDERLAAWQAEGHGKAVNHSILGRVKAQIKRLPNARVLYKYIPTTKLCMDCGAVHRDMTLRDRKFVCGCRNGVAEDRDVHAAKNMVRIYDAVRRHLGADSRTLGAERIEVKRGDFLSAYKSLFQRDYGVEEGGAAKLPRL